MHTCRITEIQLKASSCKLPHLSGEIWEEIVAGFHSKSLEIRLVRGQDNTPVAEKIQNNVKEAAVAVNHNVA